MHNLHPSSAGWAVSQREAQEDPPNENTRNDLTSTKFLRPDSGDVGVDVRRPLRKAGSDGVGPQGAVWGPGSAPVLGVAFKAQVHGLRERQSSYTPTICALSRTHGIS